MPDILFADTYYQSTGQACIVDLTPPTFAGIATLVPRSNGSLRATYLGASDPTTPIRYEVFIQASSSVGLFAPANKVLVTEKLTADIYTLADGSTILVNGTTYYVGVRAVDAVGNQDQNLVNLSGISSGVAPDSLCNLASQLVTATLAAQISASAAAAVAASGGGIIGVIEESEISGTIEASEIAGKMEC